MTKIIMKEIIRFLYTYNGECDCCKWDAHGLHSGSQHWATQVLQESAPQGYGTNTYQGDQRRNFAYL
jgi:hypothetical protein